MAFRDHLAAATVEKSEISLIHEMLEHSQSSNHAMTVFENITECPGHRSAVNMLTRDRLCAAIGIEPEAYIDTLGWAMTNPSTPILVDTKDAPCMENIAADVDLNLIPIPHHWPADRGRYSSASIIIAQDNGIRNVSFHRQFLRDKNHLVVRLVPRHLRTMVMNARSEGREVSVAVVNAPDPVVLLAAAMSFSENIDELTIAAALHEKLYGTPLHLVELPNGVQIPADAEYAWWGRITLEDDDEGPYVDITGTVDDVRQEPVIEIDGLTHRDNPIFHALIPGEAEHKTLMGLPRAPTIKAAVNEVVNCIDVHMTEGGCGWLGAVLKIKKENHDDGMKAIEAAFAGHKSMKIVTVVDEDIDITDPVRVEWAMMTRWQPDKDTIILSNQRGSSLDPSRYEDGKTSKIGFDATIDFGVEREGFMSVQ
ncbi:MAG: UbiD family decarboxylase [Candidatus Poseidonia sp.]|nr:UbiD family decarboxylase [Poseidonia sp.]MBL6748758.1 UbiD family decarboxylase [Poseidonia sp.]MBL6806005.1 UbiD family decarboxylase [Poseidonia sp.]MBL6892085.1 UbiD family decarboxylase [Poseidonia sp.]